MNKLVLVGLLLTACGGGGQKSEETLVETIRTYNENMRWSRFDNAANQILPAQRSQFVDDWDQRAKDLKITDYEVVRVDRKGPKEAKVQIKLEWYKSADNTVHETHAMQTWERRGKVWFVVDESRLRGTEMPGLPEPPMKD